MENYDYSLIEQYANVEYHVDVFYITTVEEDKDKLAKLMSELTKEKNTKFVMRKDYYSDKTGDIIIHIEWFTYEIEKVSPHISKIINELT